MVEPTHRISRSERSSPHLDTCNPPPSPENDVTTRATSSRASLVTKSSEGTPRGNSVISLGSGWNTDEGRGGKRGRGWIGSRQPRSCWAERGGFATCSSIALWMSGPSTLKSASARGEGNIRRNADRVTRSFPSSLQRGLKQVIIGHHDAMLIIYRRHTARRAKQLISQVY